MQDIHLQTGRGNPGASRLFAAAAAAAAAGDRHLRPLHHLHHHHHPSNQALKCPRCDSINTKFCYYNNYNLSQPRHFCKSCRRYWTKGGVLRNVPVGGGCRKSRRSSSSLKPPPPPSPSATKTKPSDDSSAATDAANNNNHSSSDSSTLTAATPAEIPTAIFNEYGGSCLEKPSRGVATATLYGDVGISMDQHVGGGRDDVSTSMLTEIGNFTSLMGSTVEITPFGYAGVLTQHDHAPQQQPHQQEMVVVDGFGTLDWQGCGDENNVFDMTGAVDHAYWSQQNQWTAAGVDVDHHHHQQQQEGGGGLFLP